MERILGKPEQTGEILTGNKGSRIVLDIIGKAESKPEGLEAALQKCRQMDEEIWEIKRNQAFALAAIRDQYQMYHNNLTQFWADVLRIVRISKANAKRQLRLVRLYPDEEDAIWNCSFDLLLKINSRKHRGLSESLCIEIEGLIRNGNPPTVAEADDMFWAIPYALEASDKPTIVDGSLDPLKEICRDESKTKKDMWVWTCEYHEEETQQKLQYRKYVDETESIIQAVKTYADVKLSGRRVWKQGADGKLMLTLKDPEKAVRPKVKQEALSPFIREWSLEDDE